MARFGLMSHILEAHLPHLRDVLQVLFESEIRSELTTLSITEDEFVAMFSSQRNVGMFRTAQFRLVARVAKAMNIAPQRLRLTVPSELSTGVRERAIKNGWLAISSSGALIAGHADSPPVSHATKEPLVFQRDAVHQRVMLSLKRDDSASIRTRWEFALALVAVIPLLHFDKERD